jgi:hypothetical protein
VVVLVVVVILIIMIVVIITIIVIVIVIVVVVIVIVIVILIVIILHGWSAQSKTRGEAHVDGLPPVRLPAGAVDHPPVVLMDALHEAERALRVQAVRVEHPILVRSDALDVRLDPRLQGAHQSTPWWYFTCSFSYTLPCPRKMSAN